MAAVLAVGFTSVGGAASASASTALSLSDSTTTIGTNNYIVCTMPCKKEM